MRKLIFLILFGFMLVSNMAFAQMPAPQHPVTLQWILKKWGTALGGKKELSKIRTIYSKGLIQLGGLTGVVKDWQTSSGQHKEIISLGGVYSQTSIFNGEKGWILVSSSPIEKMSGEALKQEITSNYINTFSFLLHGRLKGKILYKGMNLNRKDYILEIEPDKGEKITLFLNAKTFLPDNSIMTQGPTIQDSFMGDWKKIKGVAFPFFEKQKTNFPKQVMTISVLQMKVNAPFQNSLFQKPNTAIKDFHFSKGSFTKMPFRIAVGAILIKAKVNHSKPLWFMLDSGDPLVMINPAKAKELGLTVTGNLNGEGYGSKSFHYSFVKGINLTFPGLTITNLIGAVSSFGTIQSYIGNKVDGILGYDFLSRFIVKINYKKKELDVYDPSHWHTAEKGEMIPIQLQERVPVIKAKIWTKFTPPVTGKFLLDTGNIGSILINTPFASAHNLSASFSHPLLLSGAGAGGKASFLASRISAIQIGKYLIKNPIALINTAEKGLGASPNYDGGIGYQILKKFNLIFDYPDSKVFLEPDADYSKPEQFDASGLGLIAKGRKFNHFMIADVLKGSPAAEAGVKKGDLLIAVNDKSLKNWTLNQVIRTLKQSGKTITLIVKRGKHQLLTFKIKLKELL
jgi:hypothetical protein